LKHLLFTPAVAALLLGLLSPDARASTVYSYVTDLPQGYTGAPGSTVTFNVYFVETSTNGSGSLIVGDGGLLEAGAVINRVSGAAAFTSQALNVVPGTGFDGGPGLTTSHLTAGELDFVEVENISRDTGVFGTTDGLPPGIRQVLLDTVTVTLPNSLGTTTTFALDRNPIGEGTTVTFFGTFNLDADGSTQDPQYGGPGSPAEDGKIYALTGADTRVTTFTVATTLVSSPEPASLGIVGIAGLLALRRRRLAAGPGCRRSAAGPPGAPDVGSRGGREGTGRGRVDMGQFSYGFGLRLGRCW
jgi:hypothetical protein